MDQYKQQLQHYIERQRQQGFGDEQIRQVCIKHGWKADMVDEVIGVNNNRNSEIAVPPEQAQPPSFNPPEGTYQDVPSSRTPNQDESSQVRLTNYEDTQQPPGQSPQQPQQPVQQTQQTAPGAQFNEPSLPTPSSEQNQQSVHDQLANIQSQQVNGSNFQSSHSGVATSSADQVAMDNQSSRQESLDGGQFRFGEISTEQHQGFTLKLSDTNKKYTVRAAMSDALKAIMFNKKPVLLGGIVAFLVAFISTFLSLFLLFFTMINSRLFLSEMTVLLIILFTGLILMFSTVLYQMLLALFSSVAIDASRQSQNITLEETVKSGISKLKPLLATLIVRLMYMLIPFLPILLAMVLLREDTTALLILGLLIPMTLIWAVSVMIRTLMLPYIVIFEGRMSIRNIFKRNKQLLRKGGYWFLFKFSFVVLVLSIPIELLGSAVELPQFDNIPVQIITILINMVAFIFYNAVLVMLYFNRVAVKGNDLAVSPLD